MGESFENEYQDIIIKFLAGEADQNEILKLKEWLASNPENRKYFDREADLWQETSYGTRIEFFNEDDAWDSVKTKLGVQGKARDKVTIVNRIHFRLYAVAASVALLTAISAVALWLSDKRELDKYSSVVTRIETREGERARMTLSDSTEVVLNSGTTLCYNADFNRSDRKVRLSGEAWFDVATNRDKPFVVQLDKLNISATGTKFNVSSFGNEDRIEATLEEGHINLKVEGTLPVELVAGQQAVYFRKTGKILVRDVAIDTYTSWKENKLRFKDTPLEEVLRRVGRKYNVRFELSSPDLLELKYTATFIDESIEEVMQMLSAVSPVKYKITYMTSVNDKLYTKPKIVIGWAKTRKH
jgi:transmembrane sensor